MVKNTSPIKITIKTFCADCENQLSGEVYLIDDVLYVHVLACQHCVNEAYDAGTAE